MYGWVDGEIVLRGAGGVHGCQEGALFVYSFVYEYNDAVIVELAKTFSGWNIMKQVHIYCSVEPKSASLE